MEKSLKCLIMSLSGSDIIGQAGQLDTGKATSPIQLIIDNTIVKVIKRIISGVEVNDDTLAYQDILDTKPGNHFLEREHTMLHCQIL